MLTTFRGYICFCMHVNIFQLIIASAPLTNGILNPIFILNSNVKPNKIAKTVGCLDKLKLSVSFEKNNSSKKLRLKQNNIRVLMDTYKSYSPFPII